jgi:subtilisin family serine protease
MRRPTPAACAGRVPQAFAPAAWKIAARPAHFPIDPAVDGMEASGFAHRPVRPSRMNKTLAAALCLATSLPLAAQQPAAQDGRYVIQFKSLKGAAAAVRAAGGTPALELAPQSAIAAQLPPQALAALQRNPNVVLVEPDVRRYPMGQVTPYGISMVQADQVGDGAAGNTTICIIDSGYYSAHEDLAKDSTVSGSNDSGSGPWYEDSCGHGTHVAGTISALNNTLGVKGVLGSGTVRLHAQKVFDGASCGWAYSSSLVAALNACRDSTPASQHLVVSMSLGGGLSSSFESSAFQSAYDAGVLSVAAAGNDGNKRKSYPASYPSVISVAAVDSAKNVASFSQQNNQVELAAPGVGVLSTVPFRSSSVSVGGASYLGENLDGSARTSASGTLVNGGLCSSAGSWPGRVVLCERGGDTFATKMANVVSGGGVAAVIYNNVAGGFAGTLNGTSTIPGITVLQADGQALLNKAGQTATVDNVGGAGSGYAYYDGTSMATPHVSGVAALVWSNAPTKTNAELRAALQATAEDRGPAGLDNAYGYGIVQAKAALDRLNGGEPPPPNVPPSAGFSFACQGLSCSFTDASSDPDGTVAGWSWNFGDTAGSSDQNPVHSYGAGGTYTVTLTVTDDKSATGSTSQQVTVTAVAGGLSLSASGRKVKGVNVVDLAWSGAGGSTVDVFRDGTSLVSVSGASSYTDVTGDKGGATYTYQVCDAPSSCSAVVTVAF